ncbi:hypothetical protein KAFR_0B01280 [Kazachstania africana CBS 2517]|uniref:Protein ZIP4 homolog n=1 Tax=Kazachstania africana (strain ATCC 22294 / BCRC 22015 / CBS 2517 / CECT 1963 / NBRC 1671 / NRRL Y-8276) TaxID=1071382 RepID=H2APX7_KAZAF|nr:hypothetical protein KAFR_0B01280 [Kazachstania africana CBS 2517]CCF56427.1 hypothetical protein KAFR_0B01280 [Kazachstania africana CBS 2517]
MPEVISTFKSTLIEFCEVANWITSQVFEINSIDAVSSSTIINKIDALQPVAIKYNKSFRSSDILIDDDVILKLENSSSSLWNSIAIAIKANHDQNVLLMRCKLFSSILLSVHESLVPTVNMKLRTFKCYVNCLKTILDYKIQEANLINKVNENADTYLRILNEVKDLTTVESTELKTLKFEFYILNFQLVLKDNDIETAKIYYGKVGIRDNLEIIQNDLLIEVTRVIYNAMTDLHKDNETSHLLDVIFFLKEVHSFLELPVENLKAHIDYSNIRYKNLILLTKCLITQFTDLNECESYLNALQSEYSRKIEPYILNVSLIKKKDITDYDSINEILIRMITSVDISSNFESIMGCINEFAEANTKMALVSLDYMFTNKIDPQQETELLEKLLLTRVFITTQSKTMNESDILKSLETFCENLKKILMHRLTKNTVSCIITLLWNSGKKLEKMEKYNEAINYYELALDELFCKDYTEIAKIQRALQSCYIMNEDFENAEKVYHKMKEFDKKSPLTQLLMTKISLQKNDKSSVLQCLEKIKNSDEDNSINAFILAITECKKLPELVVSGVTLLFEKLQDKEQGKGTTTNWSVPTLCLIRYTIQMIIKLAEKEESAITNYFNTIAILLQKALTCLQKLMLSNHIHMREKTNDEVVEESISVDEIEWFASVAYNTAVRFDNAPVITNDQLQNFTKLAKNFMDMIPLNEFTVPKMFHYEYWQLKCSLLDIYVSRRSSIKPEFEKQAEQVLHEIMKLKENKEIELSLQKEQVGLLDILLVDAVSIYYDILLETRDRQKLGHLLEITQRYQNMEIECMLVDAVLILTDLPEFLQIEIISSVLERNLSNMDISDIYVCFWLRTLLEHNVDDKLSDFSGRLLTRLKINFSSNTSASDTLKQEVELIATLCWNVGINNLIAEKKDEAMRWFKDALDFAKLVNNGMVTQLKDLWKSLAPNAAYSDSQIESFLSL